ncbi:MAG: T9SS type A sorting domain-containing protein [Patescibacteria group bacterium]|nr:MAG: T9SS type A sorting domain-containing protein [Patescibacteria group bacterium]
MKKLTINLFLGLFFLAQIQNLPAQQWQTVSIPNYSGPLICGDFVNDLTGYVAQRKMWKTTDGGYTWNHIFDFPYSNNAITGMKFFNENFGVISGLSGKIMKTTDGGNSWIDISTQSNIHALFEVHFFSEENFALTGHGLASTTNGGVTWDKVYSTGSQTWFRGAAFDGNNIIAGLSHDFSYIKSNNGGTTWNTGSVMLDNKKIIEPYAIKIPDYTLLVGVISGSPYTLVSAKTSNNGQTWITKDFGLSVWGVGRVIYYNQVIYLTTSISERAVIMRSTDYGEIWSEFLEFPSNWSVANLLINNQKIYLVRSDGLISFTDINVGIQTTSTEVPDGFQISQNYPNPFNPETKINFQIPKGDFVSLKVFDITGKEVATLVNQNLEAGSYEYSFNASNLTSGVYFYTIQAGQFTETKRMVLVK